MLLSRKGNASFHMPVSLESVQPAETTEAATAEEVAQETVVEAETADAEAAAQETVTEVAEEVAQEAPPQEVIPEEVSPPPKRRGRPPKAETAAKAQALPRAAQGPAN